MIAPLITEILRLVNNLIEGVPVEKRQAQAQLWFELTWPGLHDILSGLGMKEEALQKFEGAMKGKV